MSDELRVLLEIGPKGRKVAALAPDWPGLERGGATGEAAVDRLRAYLPRYAKIARLAGMESDFAARTSISVVGEYPGTGSTDFWGISFAFSDFDKQDLSSQEVARELTLLRACWTFFDDVRSRVSAEMQTGPRGGGRNRDLIARHVIRNEQDWGRKLGLLMREDAVDNAETLNAHRDAYCAAIREFHREGRMARTWPLRYLIRHTAYHALDHTWEMEDKDLTPKGA
jgi:hypothetical protein